MDKNEYTSESIECENNAISLSSKVLEKFKNEYIRQKISQESISAITGIPQSTISKIFSGEAKMTLNNFFKICNALHVNPEEIVSRNANKTQGTFDQKYNNDGVLISDPSHLAFNGYVGKYNLYFKSTISTEEEILHGVLEFLPSKDNKSCNVDLLLYTGKTKDGNKVTKHYTGNMTISLSMSSCYCTLISEEIGEMCFLVFNHMFLFNEDLVCRMACALTTSSGGNRRPTMHRLLICKDELNISDSQSEDFKFLSGHLRLNSSDIIISESQLSAIENDEKRSDIIETIKKIKENGKKETFYKIDEASIRSAQYGTDKMIDIISTLREYSIACFNNKISSKSDEYVYNYLSNREE